VLPVAVHERLGEEGVVLLAHPIDERETRIIVGRDVDFRLAEASGLQHDACLAVLGLRRAALVENEILAGDGGRLAADLAEERGEVIILRLRPALEGMMMALRALHAHAEEELRHVFELHVGSLTRLYQATGGFETMVPVRGENLAHDLVILRVRQQAVAHPGVEGEVRGDVGGLGALVFEKRGPLVREVVGVVGLS
jgi:hypothetical protein